MKGRKPTYAKVSVSVRIKTKGKKPLVFRQDAVVETSSKELERLMKKAAQAGGLDSEPT